MIMVVKLIPKSVLEDENIESDNLVGVDSNPNQDIDNIQDLNLDNNEDEETNNELVDSILEMELNNDMQNKYNSKYTAMINEIIEKYEDVLNIKFSSKDKIVTLIYQHFESSKEEDSDDTLALVTTSLCFIIIELQIQFYNLKTNALSTTCKPFLKGFNFP